MRTTKTWLLLFIAVFSIFSTYSLEISHSPQIINSDTVVKITISNPSDNEAKLTIVSYIFSNNEKKFYVKDDYIIKPKQRIEINRFISPSSNDRHLAIIVYGDFSKEIIIPIVLSNEKTEQGSNNEISNSEQRTEKIQKKQDVITEKIIECNAPIILISEKLEQKERFSENERIYLHSFVEDEIYLFHENWYLEKIGEGVYELRAKRRVFGNQRITLYFENCEPRKIEFFVEKSQQYFSIFLFFIALIILIVFFAIMVDLFELERKREEERKYRIQAMKEKIQSKKQKDVKKISKFSKKNK
ncbi:MAG: hypothetical protein QW524_02115 [Candidatus Woesearchaeota archaeon]